MTDKAWRVTGSLSARISEQSAGAEVHLSGEFDLESSPAVEEQLMSALDDHSCLIVELSDVTFMDSSAIGVLARTKQACDARGARLTVCIGDSPARRVLDMAGMSEFLGVNQ